MLTSAQIRQQFLDFFREKQHTIVPSSSLMPDSPNLLFTNAGMNQFVPIFLNEVPCPYTPGRAADTQKCIRAGGKHNDLDDVGLDTYHHTFFEMLGNWSFGDYFKKEAIAWSWELIVERFKFPPSRVYATIYQPDPGDPSERDQEAWDLWAEKFRSVGLDPAVHIVNGNKKDNFWMMGETGPCGPCSEIHIDLTPAGDTGGALVNKGSADCIEIWNNVFIQFNANPDGTFSPLPAQHVDTGMGFERLTSIIQGTKEFADFANAKISNYETDIFRPIFDEIEKLSGQKYGSTLPKSGTTGETEQEKIDVAFRVIADHIRTLSFSVADGIQPGNTDRNYVLRRILRRAVRYGRTLGFKDPFFYKLVGILARTMGDVFPEIRAKQKHVEEVLKREEEAFNRTLDRGIKYFEKYADLAQQTPELQKPGGRYAFDGEWAFTLYDTYGFPLDLTELMARESGMDVDREGFETFMKVQRSTAQAAQKKTIIELSEIETKTPTAFLGYDQLSTPAKVLEVVAMKDKTAVVLDTTTAYAEMGGQVGDTGEIELGAETWRIANTQKNGATYLHFLEGVDAPQVGQDVTLSVETLRRRAIERHHSVTHLLHWALHEVVSHEATQKGSFVGPDKLTFDFNSQALTPTQVRDIERLVNEKIVENAEVTWREVPYAQVKGDPSIMQFFGDKYGELVRVVDIGGYSRELCAGTHTRATGEIGLFRIVSEGAIAAGVRRIEAIAGLAAYDEVTGIVGCVDRLSGFLKTQVTELEHRVSELVEENKKWQKAQDSWIQREGATYVKAHCRPETINEIPVWIHTLPLREHGVVLVQSVVDALKTQGFKGVAVLGGVDSTNSVQLAAYVSTDLTKRIQAGKIIQTIAPLVGGKGGGKPDNARGGGKDPSKLDEALAHAKTLL